MRIICPWLQVSSVVARIFLSPLLYTVGLIKPEHQAMGDFPSIPGALFFLRYFAAILYIQLKAPYSYFSFCGWPFYHQVYELNWNNFISLWEKGLHRRTSLCRCSPSMWSTFISWLKPSTYLPFQIFSHYNSWNVNHFPAFERMVKQSGFSLTCVNPKKIGLGYSHIEVPLEYEGTRFNIKAVL